VRRLIAAVAALLLAIVGTVVLVAYARGADSRAMAGLDTVSVLVVDEPVAAGTPAEQLDDFVRTELLPAKAAVPGRVESLDALAGQVATVDLEPGEQLLADRFAAADDLGAPGTVAAPEGDSEVSVLLEPQRAVGGRLAAGDTVGVFVSLTFEDGSSNTHVVLHGALVTQVQGAPAAAEDDEVDTASSGGAAPSQSLMVTLALTSRQAEVLVFGMEHGTIWLSLEPEGADTNGTKVVNQGNVYVEVGR
jgi:pilus assembly protein CpaB